MNASFKTHISDDVLERYALNQLAETACGSVEEHILICEICQARLQETDEYVALAKAAAAAERRRNLTGRGPILRKQPGSAEAFF